MRWPDVHVLMALHLNIHEFPRNINRHRHNIFARMDRTKAKKRASGMLLGVFLSSFRVRGRFNDG
jgi:hypothetical protein